MGQQNRGQGGNQGNWQDRPFKTVDGISFALIERGVFSVTKEGEGFSLAKRSTPIGATGTADTETLREIAWDAIVEEMKRRSVGELILVLESVGLDEVASEVVLRRMWHLLTRDSKPAPRPPSPRNDNRGGQGKPDNRRPNPPPKGSPPPPIEAKPGQQNTNTATPLDSGSLTAKPFANLGGQTSAPKPPNGTPPAEA